MVPTGHAFPDWTTEREGVAALIKEWDADTDTAIPHEQIAICVPTNQMAAEMAYTLKLHDLLSVRLESTSSPVSIAAFRASEKYCRAWAWSPAS